MRFAQSQASTQETHRIFTSTRYGDGYQIGNSPGPQNAESARDMEETGSVRKYLLAKDTGRRTVALTELGRGGRFGNARRVFTAASCLWVVLLGGTAPAEEPRARLSFPLLPTAHIEDFAPAPRIRHGRDDQDSLRRQGRERTAGRPDPRLRVVHLFLAAEHGRAVPEVSRLRCST